LSPASCPLWLPTSLTHHIPPTVTCAQSLQEWKRLRGLTVWVLFNQTSKQTNKQKIWRILRWIRSEIGTTNARQCQVPVWRDHTICPKILRKYSHTKYHQQCITIPIYADIDHSNTQYSSTLEVSKELRFLDANCLSDALAFQKKKLRLTPQVFLTTVLRAVLIY